MKLHKELEYMKMSFSNCHLMILYFLADDIMQTEGSIFNVKKLSFFFSTK